MSITLASLAQDCRDLLAAGDTPSAREQVAARLAQALRDPAFLREQFPQPQPERKIVYEDPQLGFCILVHEYHDVREGGPHDHGPSWAIYGQAEGENEMTEFEALEPAAPGRPGTVRVLRRYTMHPGNVHLYNEGAIHAPRRFGACKLVRIEGRDLAKVARGSYRLAQD
jgi:hypothetical protein